MWWDRLYEAIELSHDLVRTKQIVENISWKNINSDLHIVDSEQLLFEQRCASVLTHNSFEPQIRISISETSLGSRIDIEVTLKTNVRILMIVLTTFAMLLELGLGIMCIRGELVISFPLFIPILIMLFLHFLSFFGLRITTKYFIKEVRQYLSNHY